ncbi:MAG: GNAT family N-acetyltransferase [Acetivibrionales bacterium]|jgi:ribosomal protein S18 acetylase RimI-like enzyme|nr:GNAT family N-acetyltransferase [Clostridiaceae bacterium]
MKYTIRELRQTETSLLNDFLYEAIFIPEGIDPPPKTIIQRPEIQVYVENFGDREDDIALVAEVDGMVVGAVWARIMNDYGHIDDETPSLAISLYKDYRNYGLGTEMMFQIINKLRSKGYSKISLAVQKANYAVKMYRKVGFEVFNENDEEYIMICRL